MKLKFLVLGTILFSVFPAFSAQYTCTGDGQRINGATYTTVLAKIVIDEPMNTFYFEAHIKTLPPFDFYEWDLKMPKALNYQPVYSTTTGDLSYLSTNPNVSIQNLGTEYQIRDLGNKSFYISYDHCYDDGERGPSYTCTGQAYKLQCRSL